jgi:hypothetical protein
MDEQERNPAPEKRETEPETAQSISEQIARDAPAQQAERDQMWEGLDSAFWEGPKNSIFSTGSPWNIEYTKMAELDAICIAHAAAVDPLRAQLGPTTDLMTLACLLVRNQDFLKQLAVFEPVAQELSGKGRPQLALSLKARTQEAQMAIALLQSLSQARQSAAAPQPHANIPAPPPAAPPVPPPHPADPSIPTTQTLAGIWDEALSDGRKGELALAANGSFSYVILRANFAFWGTWSVDRTVPQTPFLLLQRKEGYPMNFYGMNGPVPIVNRPTEAWNITAFALDRMSFGANNLTRRSQIAEAAIQARIAQITAEYLQLDQSDRDRAQLFNNQMKCIKDTQDAAQRYIDSGAGRMKW